MSRNLLRHSHRPSREVYSSLRTEAIRMRDWKRWLLILCALGLLTAVLVADSQPVAHSRPAAMHSNGGGVPTA